MAQLLVIVPVVCMDWKSNWYTYCIKTILEFWAVEFIYVHYIMVADCDLWNVELIFNICWCLVLEGFLLYLDFISMVMKTVIKHLFSETIVNYISCNVFSGTVNPPWTFESILISQVNIKFPLHSLYVTEVFKFVRIWPTTLQIYMYI
jgi:hypothetical protein